MTVWGIISACRLSKKSYFFSLVTFFKFHMFIGGQLKKILDVWEL